LSVVAAEADLEIQLLAAEEPARADLELPKMLIQHQVKLLQLQLVAVEQAQMVVTPTMQANNRPYKAQDSR
jgi:hypothetical protein